MLLKVLRDYLIARPQVSAIIGTRLVAGVLKQNSPYPAADMRIVMGDYDHTITGLSGSATSRVIFDCYAYDPSVADDLAHKMISNIVGQRWTADGLSVCSVTVESGISQSLEGVDPGSDTWLYVSSFTLEIVFARPCR